MTIEKPLALVGDPVGVHRLGGTYEAAFVHDSPIFVYGKGWEYPVRYADGSGRLTIGESAIRLPVPVVRR